MAKWCGKIGYGVTVETEPGLWTEQIVEKDYFGDVISNRWKNQSADKINDDINVSHSISIIADPFANSNFGYMKYIEFANNRWKISDVEIQYPRLVLTIGGVYNG